MKNRKPHSQKIKEKIRKALLGRKGTLQKSINLSKALKGKPKSKEFVENLRRIRTGWRLSEITKKKISIKLKGNKNAVGSTHKHTEETKKKISKNNARKGKPAWNRGLKGYLSGEKHWKYIKDRTKLKKFNDSSLDRRSSAYGVWRKEVFKRDNFKCKINNKDCEGRLVVHHILSYSNYPESRYEINNGITLCQAHHPRKRAEEKRLSPYFMELVSVSKV